MNVILFEPVLSNAAPNFVMLPLPTGGNCTFASFGKTVCVRVCACFCFAARVQKHQGINLQSGKVLGQRENIRKTLLKKKYAPSLQDDEKEKNKESGSK